VSAVVDDVREVHNSVSSFSIGERYPAAIISAGSYYGQLIAAHSQRARTPKFQCQAYSITKSAARASRYRRPRNPLALAAQLKIEGGGTH
jgi:hypothetical protein